MFTYYPFSMSTWQPSLLGLGEPTFDHRFVGVKRITLAHGAWIDHGPGWLSGHSVLFEALRDAVPWQATKRMMYERLVEVPRLFAMLPDADDPAGTWPHPILYHVAAALECRYGIPFDRLSMALYRDGNDSVAMHGDRVMRDMADDTIMATLSVGERRRFLMKPKEGGPSIAFTLGWGDLIVMGGATQRTWLHGVPKVARAGPRMAIMFRSSTYLGGGRIRANAPEEVCRLKV